MAASHESPPLVLSEEEFDVCVVGTSLPNSILAAALCRAGKRVLHVDQWEFYGRDWASLSFQALQAFMSSNEIQFSSSHPRSFFETNSKRFLFDLRCRLVFSRSRAVDVLQRSGTSHYIEFRACDAVFHFQTQTGLFEQVPTSKQQVFASSMLDRCEKRRLMKLLHLVLNDAHSGSPCNTLSQSALATDRSFDELLSSQGMGPHLREFVLFALCQASTVSELNTSDALRRIRLLLHSMGRFSSGALLYPVYGVGELPQAFCRLAAVYGGVYVLRCPKLQLLTDSQESDEDARLNSNNSKGSSGNKRKVLSGVQLNSQQSIQCPVVVCGVDEDSIAGVDIANSCRCSEVVSRCLLVTTEPLRGLSVAVELQSSATAPPSSSGVCVGTVPPGALGNNSLIRAVQIDSSAGMCPEGFYIIQLMMSGSEDPKQELSPVVEHLVSSEPCMSVFWTDTIRSYVPQEESVEGLFVLDNCPNEIDVDSAFQQAEDMFRRLCPDLEFLPSRNDGGLEGQSRDRDGYVREAFEALPDTVS